MIARKYRNPKHKFYLESFFDSSRKIIHPPVDSAGQVA